MAAFPYESAARPFPSLLRVPSLLRSGATVEYDYLIIGTGSTHSYFGNDVWAKLAPGLKTLEDAREMRRRIMLAYELAEREAV